MSALVSGLVRGLRRWWFAAAVVFLYCYSFPYFEHIRSANELPRIYLTMAMVDRGAFDIGPEYGRYQRTPDTSFYRGRLFSNKAPGSSIVAIPAYWLLSAVKGPQLELRDLFYALRIGGGTIPSLLFLLLLWRLLRELIPARLGLQRLVLAAYALGSMAFVYGTLFMAHQLAAALIGAAFIWVFLYSRTRAGRWSLLWAGLCAGGAVLVDYQAAFVGPPLFAYVLWRARPRLRAAFLFCLGAALPLGFLLYYHYSCFGSPFSTGYEHLTNPIFAKWTSRGFLGLDAFDLERWKRLHFSADDGLFYYSPFLLLAIPGLILMALRRQLRAEAVLCGVVIAFYFYFLGALVLISGWDVGPRYGIVALPFYVPPVAVLFHELRRRWWALALPTAAAILSVLIYLSVGAVFPHFPDNFSDPLFDLTWRFAAAGYVSYNLGWLAGLRGLLSLLPYGLVALAVVGVAVWGAAQGWRRAAYLATSVGLAALLLYGQWSTLDARRMPVPMRFLPWMERIWEPRHDTMKPRQLMRWIGPMQGASRP